MPEISPGLTGTPADYAAVVVTACPLLAAYLTALHPTWAPGACAQPC